ncbi:hypothetical protein C3Y92_20450 (plasmid) [Solidesulfovibrio carbinolicus]|uniref:Uncharacterized protein n=1 Tax=Solidesulfovibrio carbinolicus TaxID=296842 RepID=A0A4P6HSF7_9BACT|nr:hypothetical protein C3Y92_20450 [Solidesulfovibrio carbinolicus]
MARPAARAAAFWRMSSLWLGFMVQTMTAKSPWARPWSGETMGMPRKALPILEGVSSRMTGPAASKTPGGRCFRSSARTQKNTLPKP